MHYLHTILLLVVTVAAQALTIPTGTLYFDNSKTQYSAVRFVFGSDQTQWTKALAMTEIEGKIWKVEINGNVENMYRFTFVGGAIPEGVYAQDFNTFKDSISNQAGYNRTATSSAQMKDGDIFVPETGDNWAQGYWTSYWDWKNSQGNSGDQPTGTLPIVYVNTKNKEAVTDTETQKQATIYIDSVIPKYHPLGSPEAPLPATIKGRGNWTWNGFDKKPYKIKFDVKQKVLGMPNNRHWCLMASADDYLGFLKMPTGFKISKAIGLRWTPRVRPVELVLNGKYMGLYFLTEHVRIASNRVKIKEQADNETHADSITGGWLVEIDNYPKDNRLEFWEDNGQRVMISLREPEVLSQAQRSYLENALYKLHTDIEHVNQTMLEQRLDLDEAAKYYLVQEIMDDCESYHGSCFLYKDRDSLGIVDKWKFGPVWDFGNAYDRIQDTWIYDNPTFEQYWIGQLAQCAAFQQKVKEQWYVYYHDHKDSVRAEIEEFAAKITPAAKNDAVVWKGTQGYNDNSNMTSKLNDFLWRYDWRISWLYSQWGEGIRPATYDIETIGQPSLDSSQKMIRDGRVLIIRNGRTYDLLGHLVE